MSDEYEYETTAKSDAARNVGITRCYACGLPFETLRDWNVRHLGEPGEDAVYHQGCCPICKDEQDIPLGVGTGGGGDE